MTIRSITVHLTGDSESGARLTPSIELARRHGARLQGLFAYRPPRWFGERRMESAEAFAVDRAQREEEARTDLATRASAHGVPWTWEAVDGDPEPALIENSYTTDLLIVGRRWQDPEFLYPTPALHERLALAASCPVLILPDTACSSVGRRILVAWKPTREAARALRDALPLLQTAETVAVVDVRPPDAAASQSSALEQFLTLHGIKADMATNFADDLHVGPIIRAKAVELGCDMIVMGAYGRPRLAQFIFGGVTQHLLDTAPAPLFVSH